MRFSISATLDAIESRLALDPTLIRGVVDLAGVVRLVGLDGNTGRPASLLRLGHVVDAFTRHLAEDGVSVYPVTARSLLSDLDLTSNERMVVRRWADDGRVEVLEDPGDRVLEVADLLGVPVLSGRRFEQYADRYPWLPAGLLVPTASGFTGQGEPPAGPAGPRMLARLWRCPRVGCAGFGTPHGGQRPPRLVGAAPTCPQHGVRLADGGPRPASRLLAVSVDGAVRARFVVREGAPAVVGRAPDSPPPAARVGLARWLGEEAMRWVSRSHLWLELRGDSLVAVDTSTNGTRVHTARGPVPLVAGQPYGLDRDDVVELYEGVQLAPPARLSPARAAPSSIMAEAPTISIRRS
jgi:hypothetical protein